MKIEANDKEIQDIFSSGYFKIPRFQRPYSWEKDEVENFWEDITKNKDENYFIGSMVVFQSAKPYFGIVDGQQRLTTITIILSVIRDSFIKLRQENLAKGIHMYIEKANVDNENEFILNAETSFPFLHGVIQSFKKESITDDIGIEEKNLENAYNLIRDRITKIIPEINSETTNQIELFHDVVDSPIQKLKDIRDKILALKLVFIQLDNEDDAYLIFETLNARGRDLKTSDLVKNLFLKKLRSNNTRYDSAKTSWNSLVSKFDIDAGENVLDNYLLHYWLSEHQYTTDKKLFSEIKEYLGEDNSKAESLLKTIINCADYYRMINTPDSVQWSKQELKIKDTFENLNSFKVKQQSSMTLALTRAWKEGKISLKMFKQSLDKIEYFHFIFNSITSQRSSGSIATTYSEHAIRLTNATSHDDVQAILKSLFTALVMKLPRYEEFRVNFIELSYLSNKTRSKNSIKYILSKQLGDAISCLNINHKLLTIEHYIPESAIKSGISADVVGCIGNLLLIDESTNNNILKDTNTEAKYKILVEKGYPLKQTFISSSEWGHTEIKKRTESIAHQLYHSISLI
ncbi:DUF262 domain-containing protein [Citrobacter braakii]|uniref:DUF262 domain-containing protein n=1 Tax=Citrobacter braakii TaxID=57706 RepID=UPI001E11BC9E|nr:DUF262 domain-containing protein [Salmonella enterica subsp. enterica serovar Duesseldorf]HBM9294615.1 DUF262 domain-containing protein [Citrobacter freundii]HBM9396166.1 DUF262 domain-containing protein [Citrobacter freundii]HCC4521778.1 DUF262 domain-containing protein [Citrobacter freundii]